MKNTTIYLLLLMSSLFSQIQRGGTPKFYDNRIADITYMSTDIESKNNRESHPMVFQF